MPLAIAWARIVRTVVAADILRQVRLWSAATPVPPPAMAGETVAALIVEAVLAQTLRILLRLRSGNEGWQPLAIVGVGG